MLNISQKYRFALLCTIVILLTAGMPIARADGYIIAATMPPPNTLGGAKGVSSTGEQIGVYVDKGQNVPHGYVMNGTVYKGIAAPGAGRSALPMAINNTGDIVGFFCDAQGKNCGYLIRGHKFQNLNPPHANQADLLPTGINDKDEIVGTYEATKRSRIFILTTVGISIFDLPGRYSLVATGGINDDETVVGSCSDNVGGVVHYHGFILKNGKCSIVTRPGTASTTLDGINNAGTIVGNTVRQVGSAMVYSSFLLDKTTYTTIVGPSGLPQSQIYSINDKGQMCGIFANDFTNTASVKYLMLTPK